MKEAPFVVTVQGPRDCGKSTLIRSLVEKYTRHKLQETVGTVSVRVSKTARISFIECPSDIAGMVDVAKVTDLALLVMDASVGFEMETFEFLNILQHHGFPACMGVLTRLDHYKENKQQRKLKKRMKKRFWKEVGDGCKLFYLSGLARESAKYPLYKKHQIHNLARYLSIIKLKPLEWRQTHPYVLADRFDVLTGPEKEESQLVQFYGYVRGTHMQRESALHLNGIGDYQSALKLEVLDDPVPLLDTRSDGTKKMKRALNLKEKALYAPYAKIGTMAIDSESVTIPDNYVVFTKMREEENGGRVLNPAPVGSGVQMVRELQEERQGAFLGRDEAAAQLLEGLELADTANRRSGVAKGKWKEEVKAKTFNELYSEDPVAALSKLIYGEESHGGPPQSEEEYQQANRLDTFRVLSHGDDLDIKEKLYFAKRRCVTGQKRDPEDVEESDQEAELKKLVGKIEGGQKKRQQEQEEEEKDQQWKTNEERKQEAEKAKEEENKKKAYLGREYGYIEKGTYVRCELRVEREVAQAMSAGDVLMVCGFERQEEQLGLLRVKVKKHRWFPTILKNGDPLLVSAGWRRYQTRATYMTEDAGQRYRMIKYTPKYGWCQGVLYGPQMPLNTPFLALQSYEQQEEGFRICATGSILEVQQSLAVFKKLKLIGEPKRVHRNTAFISGMFNSKLEVARFIGARLRTVSGIRGEIKMESGDAGAFRATFEDKILKSDLVFLRTWFAVDLPKFYNPALTYGKVRYLKTTSALRRERGLKLEKGPDYQPIERDPHRLFQQLVVPDKLQKALPYKAKQKVKEYVDHEKQELKSALRKEGLPAKAPMKLMMSANERKVWGLVERLSALQKKQRADKREAKKQRAIEVAKKEKREAEKREARDLERERERKPMRR